MLVFDEASHSYSVGGVRVPGVSEILKSVGIIDDTFYTEEGAARGKMIHWLLQQYDNGEAMPDLRGGEYEPYLLAYEKFLKECQVEILEVERPRYHKGFWYAGTPDRLLKINGSLGILDFKSGTCPEWVALQTAAYAGFYEQFVKRFALQLKSNATYSLKEFKGSSDFKLFTAAASVHNWKMAA